MNISNRTYPIIPLLKNIELSNTTILNNELKKVLYKDIIYNSWKENNIFFSENIEILSNNFQEVMLESQDKLLPILNDIDNLIDNFYQLNGTMLIKDISVSYSYRDSYLCYFIFQKETLIYFVLRNGKDKFLISEDNDDLKLLNQLESYLQLYLVFKKYAEINVQVLKSNQKVKFLNQKYINNTSQNVKIIDSTWFTSIIRNEGFKVKGHFRLQPYKDGKKLIWINEFSKNGYNRIAGIKNT